nr:MAG TPA: hypothetical protein [Caudoviricetes sp.]
MRPSSSEATERAYTQRFTVRFQLCRDVTLRFTPLRRYPLRCREGRAAS